MKTKQIMIIISIILFTMSAIAGTQSSTNYIITKDVFCEASGVSNSTNYQHMFTLAQPMVVGKSVNSTNISYAGFWFPETLRYLLKLTKVGADGQVYVNNILHNFPYEEAFDKNEVILLEAITDKEFMYWIPDAQTKDSGILADTQNPITFTMDKNISLAANFQEIQYELEINASGTANINGQKEVLPCKTSFSEGTAVTVEFLDENDEIVDTQNIVINEDMTIFQLNLEEGWNLVSLPVVPNYTLVSEILPYEGITVYEFKNGGYNTPTHLENGCGYWIKLPVKKTFYIPGRSFHYYSKTLKAGWHLIGAVYTTQTPMADIDSITAKYRFVDGNYESITDFEPGIGYWLKLSHESLIFFGEE
jgi:hypothetical protein